MGSLLRSLLVVYLWTSSPFAHGFMAPQPPVNQPKHSSALVLSAVDTMTLNWVGLAVGTVASVVVMQNPNLSDQIREAVSGNSSPVLASAGTATLSPPPAKEAVAPVAVKKPEAPKATNVVSTVEMKETQKEIQQKLAQVGDRIQNAVSTTTPLDKIYTEPYSDQVKRPIKLKSRVMEKLSKKVFMPWKRWSDL